MNIYILSLLSEMAEKNIESFARLSYIDGAISSDNPHLISKLITEVSEFQVSFLQKLDFMPKDVSFLKRNLLGTYQFCKMHRASDRMLDEVLTCYSHEELLQMNSVTAIHVRYNDADNFYLASGLAWLQNRKTIFLHLSEFGLPREMVLLSARPPSYLMDMVRNYHPNEGQSLRNMVREMGINYNRFQNDSKTYLGDTFHRFCLKLKLVEAMNDLQYTDMTLKEIAFKNKFPNYANMHRAISEYDIHLKEVPRLTRLSLG